MATYYRPIDRDLQQSEATTNYRRILTEVGLAESKTLYVSKAGEAFAGASGSATTLAANVMVIEAAAADLDTLGTLAFRLEGTTADDYVYGLRVVSHDPYADIAAILADTGTDGVPLVSGAITAAVIADNAIDAGAIAAGAITPDTFANRDVGAYREIQLSETTTARRTVLYQVGTSEAQTITVSKAGAAFAGSSSTATAVSSTEFALTIDTADLDTVGELVFKSEGATNTQWIRGIQVVQHDPYSDLNVMRQAIAPAAGAMIVTDSSGNTIVVYDTNGSTVLATSTGTTSGTQKTWNGS